ncbi:MAG: hypothetical protein ISR65_09410 [Bacteriovoracaceae bacterium]|nr:hypothetical protein [Bacteriovoracaceae bacterium]
MVIIERSIASFVLVLVSIGVILSHTNKAFFEGVYVREDHFIEWVTVVALLCGFFLCIYRVYKLKNKRSKIFLAATLLLGMLYFFGAGEEISWGQRIFNITPHKFFLEHNSQKESNLHNLVVGGKKINKIVFGLGLSIIVVIYFLIMPILYKRVESIKKLINRLAIPLPRGFHIICYLLLAFLVLVLTPSTKKGELLEFGGCWIFFMTTLRPYNHKVFE